MYAAGMLLAGHVAAGHMRPYAGIAVALATLVLTGMTGFMLMGSIPSLPVWRLTSSNLVAVRKGAVEQPAVWLVAHIDSKSQTIGMLMRVGSIGLASTFLAVMILVMIMQSLRAGEDFLRVQTAVASLIAAAAIIPFALCFVTNSSRGALDNATGIAATLLAIESISQDRSVGVLISSAEELGLAGAQAFAARRVTPGVAVNCDTIDNAGRFICMTTGSKKGAQSAMQAAAVRIGLEIKVRDIIPGILTDSVAFARAGWDTCTLSRGNLRTLARVHTSGDEPGRIDGTGIALAARLLAATVEELT